MADRPHPHQLQVHPQHPYEGGVKSLLPQKGPSTTQILAVITLLPLSGTLLALAGLTFAGTIIGLCVTTPLLIIFSPVIVPAFFVIGLAGTALLASGAIGLTGLQSLSWVLTNLREATRSMPGQLDQAKRRMQDMAGYMGQKTRDLG